MEPWTGSEKDRPYHPVADIFPLMEGDEFEMLCADISANGLLEAIWLHPDGSIIDGRNRHRACIETKTPPSFHTWNEQGSLVAFVVAMNLHRRHLTSSQQAAVIPKAKTIIEELRQKARMRQGVRNDLTSPNSLEEVKDKSTNEQLSELFNTNNSYVSTAFRLEREAPDLLEQVQDGEMSIPQAKRELTKRQRREAPPLPSDKYRVIYADPPWKYGNAGIIGDTDHYGHVGRHYPSMSIAELCAMGDDIKEMSESNAVMFLWVTSPLLRECFPVIKAWGFEYKTSFVWDKIRHNYGHYNSVRHEFLLVCTKGSCTPDVQKLYDSVQSIERTDIHSQKPEEFRQIIDTIYLHGKRIELFARGEMPRGWDGWGNEPD
jgi:N6-adenosine-specific RNA methylase IME4